MKEHVWYDQVYDKIFISSMSVDNGEGETMYFDVKIKIYTDFHFVECIYLGEL